MTLVLFTESYPYSIAAENTFLNPEVPYLLEAFDRLIIVPKVLKGNRQHLPSTVTVEESYAKYMISANALMKKCLYGYFVISSPLFYQELSLIPRVILSPRMFYRLMIFIVNVIRTYKWFAWYIQSQKFDLKRTIFYTYWLKPTTLGVGLVKKSSKNITLISRTHGSDLYQEANTPPYLPFQLATLKYLDQLFLISEHGKRYIAQKYAQFLPKCHIARLGVGNPGFIASPSQNGIFRIASCSSIIPVKRIDLLIKGISELAKHQKSLKVVWHHVGDGQLRQQVTRLAEHIFPENVSYHFWGNIPNEKVIEFYKNTPIDIFVNVSISEGIPVSIMEAQSCGIPVVATAVGGNSEIVTPDNGMLLSENPTPHEIAYALEQILFNSSFRQEKSKFSRLNWEQRFNAEKNFRDFADTLCSLLKM